jgi:hypothetical protein
MADSLILPYASRFPAGPIEENLPTISSATARSHASTTRNRSAAKNRRAQSELPSTSSSSAFHPSRVRRYRPRHAWRQPMNGLQNDFCDSPADTAYAVQVYFAILPHQVRDLFSTNIA